MRFIPISKTAAMGMAMLGSAVTFALVTLLLLPEDLTRTSPLHFLPRKETTLVVFPAGRHLLLRGTRTFLSHGEGGGLTALFPILENLPLRLASGSTVGILALPCAASGTAIPPCGGAWITVRPRIPLALEEGESARGAFALRSDPENISDRLTGLPSLAQHTLFARELYGTPLFFLRKTIFPSPTTLTDALALRTLPGDGLLVEQTGSGWTLTTGMPITMTEVPALLPDATFWMSVESPRVITEALAWLPVGERAVAQGLLEHAMKNVFGENLSITEELLPLFTGELHIAFLSGTGALGLALQGDTETSMLPRVLPRIHASAREVLTTTEVRRRQLDGRFTSVTIRMQPDRITETEGTLPSGWRVRETLSEETGRGIITAVRGRTLTLATSRALLEEALMANPRITGADIAAGGILSRSTIERLAEESPLLDLFFAEALLSHSTLFPLAFVTNPGGAVLTIAGQKR